MQERNDVWLLSDEIPVIFYFQKDAAGQSGYSSPSEIVDFMTSERWALIDHFLGVSESANIC